MAAREKKFEDEMKELESLVARIDSGELTLDESIGAFERGVALVKSLNQKLEDIERKVETLTRDHGARLEREILEAEGSEPEDAEAGEVQAENIGAENAEEPRRAAKREARDKRKNSDDKDDDIPF